MQKKRANVYKNLIEWIELNTSKEDRILVLPESPLINFITDRPTLDKYFQLLPNHIQAMGERLIIQKLKKSSPEYIIIQDVDYSAYGQKTFGKDFGFGIQDFIRENYFFVQKFSDKNFEAFIFKYKNK